MAAKKPRALGNDPFRRGAAVRPGADGAPGEAAPETPAGALPETPPAVVAEPAAAAATEKAATSEKPAAAPEKPAALNPAASKAKARKKRPAPRQASNHEAELAVAGDAGLLPADLAAAPREPRVVAVAPIAPAAEEVAAEAPPAPVPGGHASAADAAAAALVALRRLVGLEAGAPSFDVDEFGRDPELERQVRPLLDWVYDRWFRVEAHGFEKLPARGPVIVVANRAGTIPWDSGMLTVAATRHGRELRPLVEDDVFHFPGFGLLANRLGAVRACPENAERILSRGGAVAVFPEGATGFGKPFRERYRLQRFGRGGFIKLALRTRATVVPVAIVGSEEIHPLLGKVKTRGLGFPFLPLTPTFPWLGAAGLLPLPAKWRIDVGEPFDLAGHGPEAAGDEPLVMRLAEQVRGTIQAMLDARLAERHSIFR